jgi:hypothetical protein
MIAGPLFPPVGRGAGELGPVDGGGWLPIGPGPRPRSAWLQATTVQPIAAIKTERTIRFMRQPSRLC